MRDVWQDAREFRHCRKASSGRDARWWGDHTCTMASRSTYTDGTHGVGAGNGVKDVETNNWRAVCGKTASTVRSGSEGGEAKAFPTPYHVDLVSPSAPYDCRKKPTVGMAYLFRAVAQVWRRPPLTD
jgi:hypothetical protein